MLKSEEQTIEVKLFVDNEKRKVLFAESDKEFVDVLFSFLTMPLGTIVRLLGKQSQIGCLDQIYKSVEDLSPDYFQTKACKTMLLAPLNAASGHCSRLKINIDDSKPLAVYVCKNTMCTAIAECAFSSVPDVVCKCGKVMKYAGERPANASNQLVPCPTWGNFGPGVFVKCSDKFIITDDLIVAPYSTSLMLSLFERFGVSDPVNLEQTIIRLTSEKITSLLRRSLTSNEPLTALYYDKAIQYNVLDFCALPDILDADVHVNDDVLSNEKIRVVHTNNSSMLYAEVSGDFLDLIFGFLVVPLGSIIKTYSQCLGCLNNLYKSMDSDAKECVRWECKSLLLTPNSAPFFGCATTKVLQIKESPPIKMSIDVCFMCFKRHGFGYGCTVQVGCKYCRKVTVKSATLSMINPKSANKGIRDGEAYVNVVPMRFMVTDNLRVVRLSSSNVLQVISEAKVQVGELLDKEVPVTKRLALEILRAALINRTALSSVLLPPKSKHSEKKLDRLKSGLFY